MRYQACWSSRLISQSYRTVRTVYCLCSQYIQVVQKMNQWQPCVKNVPLYSCCNFVISVIQTLVSFQSFSSSRLISKFVIKSSLRIPWHWNVWLQYPVNYLVPALTHCGQCRGFWATVYICVFCVVWQLMLRCDQLSGHVRVHFASWLTVDPTTKWLFDWSFSSWSNTWTT